jgi:hypothetical protein
MVQAHFYSEWNPRMAIVAPRSLANLHQQGIRWRNPEPGSVLVDGDTLPFGLTFYGGDKSAAHTQMLTITPKFLKRWELVFETFDFEERIALAAREAYVHGPIQNPNDLESAQGYQPLRDDNSGVLFLNQLEEFRSDSHPFKTDRENFDRDSFGWSYGFLLFVLPGMYGGVHLTAWSWSFPTLLEGLMWKISCLLIASGFPVALMIWGILHVMRMRSEGVLWCLALLGVIIYLSARLYIIVESFLSLRHVPVGVYVSLEWVDLFPHF